MLFGVVNQRAKRLGEMSVVKRAKQFVTLKMVGIEFGAVQAEHLSLLFQTVYPKGAIDEGYFLCVMPLPKGLKKTTKNGEKRRSETIAVISTMTVKSPKIRVGMKLDVTITKKPTMVANE